MRLLGRRSDKRKNVGCGVYAFKQTVKTERACNCLCCSGVTDGLNLTRTAATVSTTKFTMHQLSLCTCAHWPLVLLASTNCRVSSPSAGCTRPMPERPTRASTAALRCAMPTPDQAPHCTLLPAADHARQGGDRSLQQEKARPMQKVSVHF